MAVGYMHFVDASRDVDPSPVAGPAQRHGQIAEAAYFLAEARGFAPGLELDDWLEAERAVDARLADDAHRR
jgi:hypothetical protein